MLGGVNIVSIAAWEKGEQRPLKFKGALQQITGWDWDFPPGLFPKHIIVKALDEANGVRAKAAKALGTSIANLGRRMRAFDISRPSERESGLIGASLTRGGKWRSQGYFDGTTKYLGSFDTEAEAHAAYMAEKRRREVGNPKPDLADGVPDIHATGGTYIYIGNSRKLKGCFVELMTFRTNGRATVRVRGTLQRHLVGQEFLREAPFTVGSRVVYQGGKGRGVTLEGGVFTVQGFRDGRKVIIENHGKVHIVDYTFLSLLAVTPEEDDSPDPLDKRIRQAKVYLQKWFHDGANTVPDPEMIEIAIESMAYDLAMRSLLNGR